MKDPVVAVMLEEGGNDVRGQVFDESKRGVHGAREM